MPAASLEIAGLTAGYGPTVIVEDLSFAVPAGGRLAILGRNGAGKTTLLATLMGLTRRHGGAIRLDGSDITQARTADRARQGLGYVPQGRQLFPSLSVEENLFVGLKGRPRAALQEAYALFPRLAERRRSLGRQLSGGEGQMLATARALLGRPAVLLLDEPLEGLAPVVCEALMAAFARLAAGGETTILLVEQRVEDALAFADRVLVIERGRLAWSGSPHDFRDRPVLAERLIGMGRPADGAEKQSRFPTTPLRNEMGS